MESLSPQVVSAAKLPILNPNEFDPWKMRIEQYFLMIDYSLWERLARKNKLKARGTLLTALPDKNQLTFNTHKDAKTLIEAIEKRFGGNTKTKKIQKTLLKQQYENFTSFSSKSLDQIHDRLQKLISQLEILGVSFSQEDINLKFLRSLPTEWMTHTLIWRNKTDLEKQSLDDLFNSLKIYEAEVKSSSSTSTFTQNIDFVSSSNTDSTNEPISAAASVSAVSAKLPVSALPNVDSLSNAVTYLFFTSQYNSPQLYNNDLKQIDADDLEEMDLKWQMAMLTVRARQFLQRTGRNLRANGPTSIGFDMSKVECYNCHRKGHISRECRSPKDTRRNETVEPQRKNVPVETSTSNALVSQCDGVGSYDWSFQADKEPTNYALMAFTSSSSSFDNEVVSCSKACTKAYATLQSHYDKLTDDYRKSQFDVISYKIGLESVEARLQVYQQNETVFEEDIKLLKLEVHLRDNALDESKTKIPYNVPSFVQLTEQVKSPRPSIQHVETSILTANPKIAIPKPTNNGKCRNRKACFVCQSLDHLIKDCDYHEKKMSQTPPRNHAPRGHHKQYARMSLPHPQRHVVPTIVLTQSKLVPIPTARPVTTVVLKDHVTRPRPAKTIITKPHSPPRRHINRSPSPKASTFPPKVTAFKVPQVNDAKGVKGKWEWKPKCPILDHVSHNTSASMTLKRVIDSGCSRHMIGNMSYMFDFKKLNSGYVAFGSNPKGGKISRKGKIRTGKLDFDDVYFVKELKFNLFSVLQMCYKKNSVLFIDTECLVLSLEFKLPDENQVLLRVPRENNMYNVDLKNIVPSGDLTCLFAKPTLDESNLWHRRLGHINFKTMNKLVKGNLVRGLPSKAFENDHTCFACKKGKQHRASCKTKPVSSVNQPLQKLHMDLFGPIFVKSLNKKSYCLVVTYDYSRTLIEAAKTMLADSLLPIPFCAEAVNTACYVQNRVLVTKHQNKTTYELLHGRTPSIGFMRPFGCPVTILNTLDSLGKFDGKVDEGFLVGYSVSSKAFRVFNSRTQIVQETLHINYLENKPNVAEKAGEESVQQYVLFPVWSSGSTNPQNTDGDAAFDKKEPEFEGRTPESEVHVSPSSSAQSKKHDEKTKREDKGKIPAVGQLSPNSTNTFSAGGPSNATAKLEDITYSDDEDDVGVEADFSNLETTITECIDYEEVFAPVSWIKAIRLFLAYAYFMGFMVYQMDVKSAFLYGTIEEEVYVCQPLGFEDLDYPDKVYKVVKALYGLHQAPRACTYHLADDNLHVPLEEIEFDNKLHFVEETMEIMDRGIKKLKKSLILIVKVRWNSRRGLEFTWEREDEMKRKGRNFRKDETIKWKIPKDQPCTYNIEDIRRLRIDIHSMIQPELEGST
uniref:Ribonuclease H-like domain-containing protein n=1 Tax=Tanacetum cinerariifolium TaxID=118510 RepID=A0A6L2MXT7_TANCI|nr:ribonuclease H-like domain-containing protein [Tanacetum cinerariifolium]